VIVGGHEGAETAVCLARYGRQVTLVERGIEIGRPVYIHDYARQIKLSEFILDEKLLHPITVIIKARLVAISEGWVVVSVEGKGVDIEADTVVIALGRRPNDILAKALRPVMQDRVHAIGDCRQVRSIGHATEQGAYVARHI